jgi:hypothetical protein
MAVFFNRELVPLWEVLAEGCPEGTGLLGHDVTVDEKGRLDVTPTEGGDKVRYTQTHRERITLGAAHTVIGTPRPHRPLVNQRPVSHCSSVSCVFSADTSITSCLVRVFPTRWPSWGYSPTT